MNQGRGRKPTVLVVGPTLIFGTPKAKALYVRTMN